MKVFIAGATGAIGKPLVKLLIERGYQVFGMTRSQEKSEELKSLGAEPIVADALDSDAVNSAVTRSKPDVVIEQLTSLPQNYTPEEMQAADAMNTRLRVEGGSNLQRAAETAGTELYLVQSAGFFYAPGDGLADESTPFASGATPFIEGVVNTFSQIENRVLNSSALRGIALRYGMFYGPVTWYENRGSVFELVRAQGMPIVGDGRGVWPFVHVDDAAQATVTAMDKGIAGIYNIVDDDPSPMSVWLPALAAWLNAPEPPHLDEETVGDPDFIYYGTKLRGASNQKAKDELDFHPRPLEWL